MDFQNKFHFLAPVMVSEKKKTERRKRSRMEEMGDKERLVDEEEM